MAITTKQDNQAQLATDLFANGNLMGPAPASYLAQEFDPTNATVTLETVTSPDTIAENNAANATAQIVYDNNNDTVNTDTIPVATTVIFGDQGQTDTVTGTNAAHAINIALDSAVALTLNDTAADTVTVAGQNDIIFMGAAADTVNLIASTTVPGLIHNGAPTYTVASTQNTVDMGSGANQVVNDGGTQNVINTGSSANGVVNETGSGATINMGNGTGQVVNDSGTQNTINAGQGANQVINEHGQSASINQGNNIFLATGADQVINSTGHNNNIRGGSGIGQTINDSGTGNVIAAGTGSGETITETGAANTISDTGAFAGLAINASGGANAVNFAGGVANETVNLGGDGNVLNIGSGSGSVAYSGVRSTDTLNIQDKATDIVSESRQIAGSAETVQIKFGTGETITLNGTASSLDAATLNFGVGTNAPTSQGVSSIPLTTGGPSQANSSLVLTPTTAPADGTTTVQATVTARDANNNLLANQAVSLVSSDTGDHIVAASGFTNSSGVFTTTLTSTLADATDTITASIGSGVTETANENFTSTQPVATTINVTPTNPTAEADGVGQVVLTATVLDQFGHALGAGQTVNIQQSGHSTLPASEVTNAAGQVSLNVTDNTVESNTITFTDGSAAGGTHAIFTAPIATTEQVSISPASAPADGVSTEAVNVVLTDDHGVGVSGSTINFSTSGGSADTLSPASVVTGPSGTATTLITSTTANPADVVTASDTTDGLSHTATAVFTPPIVAGAPDPTHSSITVAPTSIVADGIQQGIVQVTVEDSAGHLLANTLVNLTTADVGDTLGASSGLTNSAGVFSTSISSITPAAADAITATEGTATETTNVAFTSPAAPASIVVTGNTTIIGDGVDTAALVATVTDQNGVAVANAPVTISEVIGNGVLSTTQATTSATGQITENVTDATPGDTNVLEFSAGNASAETIVNTTQPTPGAGSTLTVAPASVQADGVTPATVTVTLVDAKGVPIANDQVNLEGLGAGDSFAQTSGTTNASGVFSTTVTSTTAEIDTITAAESTGQTQTGTVTFAAPPAPSATNSTLVSADTQVAADGVQTTGLTLTVKDQFGAVMANQTVTLASSGTGDHLSATTVTTDANGQAQVNLASTAPGNDTVTATESNGAAETVTVAFTQEPSATRSSIVAAPTTATADGVTPVNLTITVKDTNGNPIANQTVTLSSTDSGDHFGSATVTTNAAGIATTSLTSTTPGADSIKATETYAPFTPASGTPPAPVAVSETAGVTFTPQSVATTINLTGALTGVADSINQVVLAGTLLDQNGVAMADQTVTVTESGHGHLSSSTLTTSATGTFSETVTDGTAETNNVVFTDGAAHATAATVFAAPVATTITATASPASVPADGHTASTITAHVLDQAGNAMGAGSAITASATGAAALGTLSGVTNASGTFTDTIVDHIAQASTITLHDGSATTTANVTFTGTGPQDISSDMTSAALTTLLESQGISAATMTQFLSLIAPQGDDTLYPVEQASDPTSLAIPDVSFVDSIGTHDQPSILDVLIANATVNTNSFPNLGGIFDDGSGHLIVTGSHAVDIAGNDSNLLLADSGADTVIFGNTAADKITLGAGHDTVTFGTGLNDIGIAGNGSGQSMTANGASATLSFGGGSGQSLTVNGANSTVQGGTGVADTATANGSHDILLAGTSIGESLKGVAGTTFKDATSGLDLINGLAGGETYSLGHGELTSVQAGGGNNVLGFALSAGAVVSISGLTGTDQLNFQAAANVAHATNIGNEEIITFTGSPGEVLALSFASQAAAQAAMAHAAWSHSV